ncbi:MAG: DEAD/DEAH box helicase, partial [Sciscionella sp.]
MGSATATVEPLPPAFDLLAARLRAASPLDPAVSELIDRAVTVWSRPGFDVFLSTPNLTFTPFDYQYAAARTVLRRMRGRAILADEVGLGKTIEAGLIASELRCRGLADRVLVLCPAGLVEQWREELERKFGLPTVLARARDGAAGLETAMPETPAATQETPIVVASLAAARRDPLQALLTARPWDVVIADEAHRLRNSGTASGKLARALRSRYLLLLTATPVENRLGDLYELVSLVAPGLLGTAAQFRRAHVGDGIAARNVEQLRQRTAQVMVRHRRSEVAVRLPQRLAETVAVPPSAAETRFYADLTRRVRDDVRTGSRGRWMALRGLVRLAGSTPSAAVPTLEKLGWVDLADAARSIENPTKIAALFDRLARHAAAGEKVLVFTGFRHTLDLLCAAARRSGIRAAVY